MTDTSSPVDLEPAAKPTRSRFMRRLLSQRSTVVWAILFAVIVAAAIFAPLLTPYQPDEGDLLATLRGPSGGHWLGTDQLGRDTATRVLYGTRVALLAATEATLIAIVLGLPIGLFIGYRGGRVDRFIMRVVEAIVSMPFLVLAIALISVIGPGLSKSMLIVGIIYATFILRLARGEVLAEREQLYVDAARVSGETDRSILFRQILPNVTPPLIVQVTLLFANGIIIEATLSFLGLGVQPPTASLGSMLSDAQSVIRQSFFTAVPPGAMIFLIVLTLNQLGDGLRDVFGRAAKGGSLGVRRVEPLTTAGAQGASGASGEGDAGERTGRSDPGDPIEAAEQAARLAATVAAGADASDTNELEVHGVRAADRHATKLSSGRAANARRDGDDGSDAEPILVIDDLSVSFPGPDGQATDVVSRLSFDVRPGEVLGLVGESGSGKSVSAMSVLGLVPDPGRSRARSIRFDGRELVGLSFNEMRPIRGAKIGVVFQEPLASLNPAYTVGEQVAEVLREHLGMSRSEATERVVELFELVGITHPRDRLRDYPHQFSGGMAQRVMIAMALACEPALIIADEPTTALDVTVQGQVVDLLLELRERLGTTILLITHDLGVVAEATDRVAVMYAGELVESGPTREVFACPAHPYTAGLLRAIPRNRPHQGPLESIEGTVPSPGQWPRGCHFADRCDRCSDGCRDEPIALRAFGTRLVRCIHSDQMLDDAVAMNPMVEERR